MKKVLVLLFLTALACIKSNAQFSENFETFPLTQFSVAGSGYTATQNTTYYEQGTSSVLFTTSSVSTQGAFTMNSSINLTTLSNPKLSFYHVCATEAGSDYGYVQYSVNGGTWTSFPTSTYLGQGTLKNSVVSFDASSYTDWATQFTSASSTPGTSSGGAFWKQEIIDLSSFATSTNFRVRFAYTTNASSNYYGWLIDRAAIVSATALSGSAYTINNTVATGGTNYNNFRDAITDLNIKGISSSVMFNVVSGQIFKEDAPAIFATGTSGNAISFIKSGSNANPLIQPTGGASTIDAGITISGGDYITFDGIDIAEATGNSVEYGYYIASASKTNGAQNNTIKNTSITLNRTNTSSFGIYQYAKYDPTHVNTDANNYNTYYNLAIKNVYGGIYLLGFNASNYDIGCEIGNILSSASFNNIGDSKTANDIGGAGTGAYGIGIRAKNQNSIKIYNNEVSNVYTSGSDSKAIGIFLENSSGNSFVYNNKVHDITTTSKATSLPPIVTGIRSDVSTGATATIYNNFVYSLTHSINGSTATTTPVIQGIAANVGSTKGNVNVYHNSVNLIANSTNASCTDFYTASGTSAVKNNVFSNTSTSSLSTVKQYAVYYSSGTLTSDYNDLYVGTSNNNFIGYYNIEQSTLANWKSATGSDASSRNENPPFVSATDLHIPNGTFTELESSGTTVGINTDIDAQTRPGPSGSINGGGTVPDIGADEFDGVPVSVMTYSSSTATQTAANVCQGAQNVQIIGMQVVTANNALPLTLTSLVINPNGTTSVGNSIATYQVYYTGTSNTFNISNPINVATAITIGNNTVTPTSTVTLSTGVNYFWLVYNLKSTATGSLDAQFNGITVTSGSTPVTYTPTTTDPLGSISVYVPSVTINPATSTVCSGTSTMLTASGADTYVWTPVTGLSASTGSTVTATPTATTTYIVTGTSATTGCTNTATSVITVNTLPDPVTVTSSPTGAVCSGTIVALSSAATASVSTTVSSGTISANIPANSAIGDSSVLTVSGIPANAIVTGISVTFNINHSYDGHLSVGLHAPNDVVLNLVNKDGGSGQNFINTTVNSTATNKINTGSAPFTDSYAPDAATGVNTVIGAYINSERGTSFADLYNIANGKWSFFARDNTAGDVGIITDWSITVTYNVPPVWTPVTNLYTDATASTVYTANTPVSTVYFKQANTNANPVNNVITATTTNGNNCSNSGTTTIVVNPSTEITAQPNTMDQNLCVNGNDYTLFVSAIGLNLTYQWYSNSNNSNSGGTLISGATSPTYTISTTASSSLYYYVIVSGGCGAMTSNVSGKIDIGSTQIINQPTGATYCQNNVPTALSVTASGSGIAYQWYSNTANSNTDGVPLLNATGKTYIPSTVTTGTLYYYVIITGDCDIIKSNVAQVIVNAPSVAPTTVVSTATNNAICVGQSTQLIISGGSLGTGSKIAWYAGGCGNGSSLGSTASITVSPTTTTIYYGRYEDPTPCSVNTACVSITITVNSLPAAYTVTGGGVSCSGTPVAIGLSNSETGVNYQLYLNGSTAVGSPVTGTSTAIPFASQSTTGTYTVIATNATTGCTQNMTGSVTITAGTTPTATITAATPSTVCAGTSVQVTIAGTAGASVTYTTNGINPQTVTLTGGSYQFNTPSNQGTYTYQITNVSTATCTNTTTSQTTVNVYAIPDATITIAPGNGSGYVQIGNSVQYQTTTGGGAWSSDASTIATVDGTGKVTGVASDTTTIRYTVTQNGCTGNGSLPIIVTADFITKQAGKYSDFHTWNIATPNGISASTSPIPQATNTIQVQDSLALDQNLALNSRSFVIAGTNGKMTILPNIVFSSTGTGVVAFNGRSVTVQSNDQGTGSIGQMATAIGGATNVTVERYIPLTTTNGSAGRTGRAWRLLTSPVTGMSIKQAWQEGKTWQGGTTEATAGLGTLITGQGIPGQTESATFDYIASGGHNTSILQYNPAANDLGSWGLPSINNTTGTNTALSTQPAWMLFVRGDRTKNTATSVGTTTLRATGTLQQAFDPQGAAQPITVSVPAANVYTLVGNPFASPINFEQIYNSTIQPQFFTWNSKLGVYGAYSLAIRSGANSYNIVPEPFSGNGTPDAQAQFIQSGEGFFVQPANATDGSLSIGESAKATSASAGINPYRVSSQTEGRLFINLNLAASGTGTDTAAVLADGVMARFDKSYAAAIDGDDIRKQANFNENLGIESNSASLMVEARPEVKKTDTVQLKLWNVTKRSYQLQLKGVNFAQAAATQGLHAYVEDLYLKTRQEVSLSGAVTTIAFAVTSDAASYDSHRFRVVFEAETTVLPITLTQVKAQLQNGGVSVSWTTQNEVNVKEYTVERSVDGGSTFSAVATATAKNNGATAPLASYQTFDAAPHKGDNFYRIRVEGVNGKVTYTNVVKVTVGEDGEGKTLITLYPNPVSRKEGKAWLSLHNVKEGDYLLSVYSQSGQNIVEKKITVAAGGSHSQTESLPISSSLAQGTYQLQLSDASGKKVFASKLIVGK